MRFQIHSTTLVTAIVYLIVGATFAPTTWASRPASLQKDPVFVGAGDVASCYDDNDEATARLLDEIDGTVFTLGDNAYDHGSPGEFASCYGPTWGRHLARTRPVPGNHDYLTPGAQGYFDYFGTRAGAPAHGFYSFDLGEWHVVALNTNCVEIGGCGEGSAQLDWLRADLAANTARCALAYGHHPLFSSGGHDADADVASLWSVLYGEGVDVVLAGHDHTYERFALQDPAGAPDPDRGIRQFVVGTGGAGLYHFEDIRPNSEARDSGTHGVLRLVLTPTGYEWEFVGVEGSDFTESGIDVCH